MRTASLYEVCYHTVFRDLFGFSPFRGADFVFYNKDKVKGRVTSHFRSMKAEWDASPGFEGVLEKCSFEDDCVAVPLQAADLLAYELRRRNWDKAKAPDAAPRPTYKRLTSGFLESSSTPPYRLRSFRCYDKRFLRGLVQALQDGDQLDSALRKAEAPRD